MIYGLLLLVAMGRDGQDWLSALEAAIPALLFMSLAAGASGRLTEREWFQQQHPDVAPKE